MSSVALASISTQDLLGQGTEEPDALSQAAPFTLSCSPQPRADCRSYAPEAAH